jgi:rRNA maturation endonuclease Nob1
VPEHPKGIELWRVICPGCKRDELYSGVGNDLVGMHEKLVCEVCGHRGADLRRGWYQWPPPKGVKVWRRR